MSLKDQKLVVEETNTPELPLVHDTIYRINIFEILPDRQQPRRSVPSDVRFFWDGSATSIPDMLMLWEDIATAELGEKVDIQRFLFEDWEYNDTAHREVTYDSISKTLIKLLQLAVSIRRDGLTNPITVKSTNQGYQLETGERRWLAHHILNLYFPQENCWSEIEARFVPEVDIWRQANENNAREDLNAIGKARQLAALLMEIHYQYTQGASFTPLSDFPHEREYYAQITKPPYHRVPRGKSELLLNATALKHSRQISHYRALLTLPDAAWDIADDYNLPERSLRPITKDKNLTNEEKVERLKSLVRMGDDQFDDRQRRRQERLMTPEDLKPGTRQYFRDLAYVVSKASPHNREESLKALTYLDELENWIINERNKLEKFIQLYDRQQSQGQELP